MPILLKCTDGEVEADDRIITVSPYLQKLESSEVELKNSKVEDIEWIIAYSERHDYEIVDVLPKPLKSNLICHLIDDDKDDIQNMPLGQKRDILNAFDELEIWN